MHRPADANAAPSAQKDILARLSTLHDELQAATGPEIDLLIMEQTLLLKQLQFSKARRIWRPGERWLSSDGYFEWTGEQIDGLPGVK